MPGPLERLGAALARQRGALFPWAPVLMAAGIGTYFALRWEPTVALLAACGGLAGLALAASWRWRGGADVALVAVACLAGGFAWAGLRAHLVAGPVLEGRYYGPIEGRVVAIDRSASDALRLTLDRVALARRAPEEVPHRVRVALHGRQDWIDPAPGMTVILTGHLAPPSGPAEPGGFDFRRHAWFLGLGAVGYTRSPVLVLEPAGDGLRLAAARMAIAARVRAALPGETGSFAAAIMTGDRSSIGEGTQQALRDANLAHLLAISGLHMGLLAGVVFGGLRLAGALVPPLALRVPVKKAAAVGGLAAAAAYLALSGASVATQRAFVMVAVALVAVLFDRRALSLRAVALAALIVLALRPEALLGPGFQMSFAATVALVAAFGWQRDAGLANRLPGWLRPVLAVVLSSAVAGAATAPVAMAHFNRVAHLGLAANLASVPLMGTLVMPAAVAGAALMPFGAERPALWLMGAGLDWILGVAHRVAEVPGAVGHVASPPAAVLPMLAAGGLVVVLWRGHARWAGVAPAVLGVALWCVAERPVMLVSEGGGLVGVATPEGRALSRARGQGFVAGIWLENDGDGAGQEEAAARWPRALAPPLPTGGRVLHIRGKAAETARPPCRAADIVVSDRAVRPNGLCRVLGPDIFAAEGAVAFYVRGDTLIPYSVRAAGGARLWTPEWREPIHAQPPFRTAGPAWGK